MKKLIKRFREWRDRRFRERIDRVYFDCDKQGNRYLRGNLRVVRDPVSAMGGSLAVARDTWIAGDVRASGGMAVGEDVVYGLNMCHEGKAHRERIRIACEGPSVVRRES